MKHKLREYGLSITLLGLFFVIQVGLSLVGQRQYNHEQADHGQPTVSYLEYVRGPAFLEATMENWESEFLQMFAYVLLTAFLFQKGSAESKDPEKQEAVDRDPRQSRDVENAPWPVRKGGIVLKLYENSLSIALFLLFAIAFVLHAVGGAKVYSQQQTAHGEQAVTVVQYLGTARFGLNPCKTGKASFFRLASWSC